MKKVLMIAAITVSAAVSLTSCKHDYICKCTNTVLGVETTTRHDLENQYHHDAEEACQRFEDDANSTTPGTTNCNL